MDYYVFTVILMAISVMTGALGATAVTTLIFMNKRFLRWFIKKYSAIAIETATEITSSLMDESIENQSEC